jgi:hypothetical protein
MQKMFARLQTIVSATGKMVLLFKNIFSFDQNMVGATKNIFSVAPTMFMISQTAVASALTIV